MTGPWYAVVWAPGGGWECYDARSSLEALDLAHERMRRMLTRLRPDAVVTVFRADGPTDPRLSHFTGDADGRRRRVVPIPQPDQEEDQPA